MQINGIGSNTTSGMYQNTNRKPNYEMPEKSKEEADLKQQPDVSQAAQFVQFTRLTPDEKKADAEDASAAKPGNAISLGEWFRSVVEKAKLFVDRLWNGEVSAESAVAEPEAAKEAVLLPQELENGSADGDMVEIAAEQNETMWQKIRVHMKGVADYLMKRFSASAQAPVSAKPEQEDRPGQPQGQKVGQAGNIPEYMKDHPEMGRMLRDEKYFATTYNKKGQYTTFSAPTNRDTHVIDKDL